MEAGGPLLPHDLTVCEPGFFFFTEARSPADVGQWYSKHVIRKHHECGIRRSAERRSFPWPSCRRFHFLHGNPMCHDRAGYERHLEAVEAARRLEAEAAERRRQSTISDLVARRSKLREKAKKIPEQIKKIDAELRRLRKEKP